MTRCARLTTAPLASSCQTTARDRLDTAPATISVLSEIVDAVAGAVEVDVDGGSGVDRRAQSDGLWCARCL